MGVKNLWRLLLPIGRRISIETLSGQTLAVDASIWLTQFLKAMRDPETGKVTTAAHLIGFFRRLCRLRFHGIKPVFVFDGATPEIKKREIIQRRKRREQFATLTDGSVQRLAKKLLAETLQKQAAAVKKSKNGGGGAFVAGFDPGEQEAGQRNDGKKETRSAGNDASADEDAKPAAAVANGSSQEEFPDEVEILSTSLSHQPHEQQQQQVSDWDLPLAVAAAEEAKEMDAESFDDDSNIEYDTLNDFSQISVDQISSLPATQRKDAIERAKRQQRLQARKEFMPAAANPMDFSQVQLQNFLKSCKLNKDIEVMAKAAAAKDNMGLAGEVMASDRTTRVELVREEEEEAKNDAFQEEKGVGGPVSLLEAKLKSKKQAIRRRILAKPTEDNSSDEESWGDKNNAAESASKRRVIDDDDESSDNESVKEIAVRTSTGRVYVRDTIELDDDDDDDFSSDNDEQSGDGFVRASSADSSKPAASRNRFTFQINNDDSSSDGEGGGFLKPRAYNKAPTLLAKAPEIVGIQDLGDSSDGEAGGFIKPGALSTELGQQQPLSSNGRYAQELQDRAIAQALQEEEVAIELPDDSYVHSQRQGQRAAASAMDLEDSMLVQALQRSETDGASLERKNERSGNVPRKGTRESCGSSNSGNDVDWEDGASPTSKSGSAPTNKTSESMVARKEVIEVDDEKEGSEDLEDEIDWEDGEAPAEHTNPKQTISTRELSSSIQESDSRKDTSDVRRTASDEKSGNVPRNGTSKSFGSSHSGDDVDWEEGASPTSKSGSAPTNRTSELMAARKEVIEVDDEKEGPEDSEDEIDWEDGEALAEHANPKQTISTRTLFRFDDEVDEIDTATNNDYDFPCLSYQYQRSAKKGRQPNNPMSPETSAALLHAQATAANLTNWAGRAFRQAIQEAGGSESPSKKPSTKPSSLTDDARESDRPDRPAQQLETNLPAFENRADGASSEEENERSEDSLPNNQRLAPAAAPADVPAALFDASFLRENEAQWTAERNKRERDMDTISDEMLEEVKELLQLFGVPYIEAPAEAEAQCAALEQLGLVDGIVTEDSDVFVFNGRTVYKNIFDEQKYAEVYRAEDAEREMKIGKNAMIALAMMLGGDYTEGIKGVGIVNAMEILDTFDVSQDLKGGLILFKKWLDGFDPADFVGKSTENANMTKEQQFHAKHRSARARWIAPPNFPADNVIKAYLDPVVDKSTDRFSWGVPDVENLILFCNRHIGWSSEETERVLDPVVKELGKGLRQTRIDSFMRYEDSIKFADVRSKRLREVLGLKRGTDDTSEAGHVEEKSSKKKRI